MQIQTRRWCRTCRNYTLHARPSTGMAMGCIATVLTAGLFLPVWLLMFLFRKWTCQACGSSRWT